MNAATHAIDECVKRFVQDILAMIEQARAEGRTEALEAVAGLVVEMRQASEQRKTFSQPAGRRAGGPSAKKAVAPKVPGTASSGRALEGRSRAATRTVKTVPKVVGKPEAGARRPEMATPKDVPSAPCAPTLANASEMQANDCDAAALAAARALVRATWAEVAVPMAFCLVV